MSVFSGSPNGNVFNSVIPLTNRLDALEGIYYAYEWFAEVSSGTTGTITVPTGGIFVLDSWAEDIDAVVSTISTGTPPDYEHAREADGTIITTTFTSGGAYTLSGTPASYPVAIIFRYKVKPNDLDPSKILNTVKLIDPVSSASATVTGQTIGGGAGTVGAPYYLTSTDDTWLSATKATEATVSGQVGVCSAANEIMFSGLITLAHGLGANGTPYYVGAGVITSTKPTTIGEFIKGLGTVEDSGTIRVDIDPSYTELG